MVGSNEHAQLREALEFCLEKDLERILLSNPSDPDHFSKSKIRPLLLKGKSDLPGRGAERQTGFS